ncbi:STAS domain-containing protein [Kitasatospora indigofera]|uniref:STAS domain-containing protein n=1 Tax=Kitasatospora indigofera TaxID=67307 RepID=UPI0036B50124
MVKIGWQTVKVTCRRSPSSVGLRCRLRPARSPWLHRALAIHPASPKLVIDLAAVTFCDSTGIGALLLARTEADRQGVTLYLANPTQARTRVLEITGIDRTIPVEGLHRAD